MIKRIVKENLKYLITMILMIIVFSIIMRSSLHDSIILFDSKINIFMKEIFNKSLTSIFSIVTNFGDYYIPLIICMCIFLIFKNKWYFLIISFGYLFAGVTTYIAKYLALRPRPLEALIEIPRSYSFPSGHTLTSLVFYCLLCYLLTFNCSKKVKLIWFIITTIFVCIIAISRIYLGVHYFSDVAGGYIIGIPCLMIVINTIENFYKEKLK